MFSVSGNPGSMDKHWTFLFLSMFSVYLNSGDKFLTFLFCFCFLFLSLFSVSGNPGSMDKFSSAPPRTNQPRALLKLAMH